MEWIRFLGPGKSHLHRSVRKHAAHHPARLLRASLSSRTPYREARTSGGLGISMYLLSIVCAGAVPGSSVTIRGTDRQECAKSGDSDHRCAGHRKSGWLHNLRQRAYGPCPSDGLSLGTAAQIGTGRADLCVTIRREIPQKSGAGLGAGGALVCWCVGARVRITRQSATGADGRGGAVRKHDTDSARTFVLLSARRSLQCSTPPSVAGYAETGALSATHQPGSLGARLLGLRADDIPPSSSHRRPTGGQQAGGESKHARLCVPGTPLSRSPSGARLGGHWTEKRAMSAVDR